MDEPVVTAWWPMYNFQNRNKIKTRSVTRPQTLYSKETTFLLHIKYKLLQFVNRTVHVSHSSCVSVCVFMFMPHSSWTKIKKIYKWKFSSVSKDTSPISDPRTSNSGILYRRKRNLCQFVRKKGEKNKNNSCCKASWANTQM